MKMKNQELICHIVVILLCFVMSCFAVKYVINRWKDNVKNKKKQDWKVWTVISIIVVYVVIIVHCVYCLVKGKYSTDSQGLLGQESLTERDSTTGADYMRRSF